MDYGKTIVSLLLRPGEEGKLNRYDEVSSSLCLICRRNVNDNETWTYRNYEGVINIRVWSMCIQ
jgi:hypothetical protein